MNEQTDWRRQALDVGYFQVRQWSVTISLTAMIVLGCYTMLLTWPLTQDGAKLELEGRCETGAEAARFNVIDRQIYGLVLHPCRDHQRNRDDEELLGGGDTPAGEGADRGQTPDNGTLNPEEPKDIDITPSPDEAQAGAADGPDEAGQADAAGETDSESTEADTAEADPSGPNGADDGQVSKEPAAEATQSDIKQERRDAVPGGSFAPSRTANALFLAVLAAGVTGGAVYSLRAHTLHVARGSYDPSWTLWNVTRPFLGGALAVLLFFVIRAGFVENGQMDALRPEGFIALGGLVGLFTDQAWARMRLVAESVFAKREDEAKAATETPEPAPPDGGSAPAGDGPRPGAS